MVSKKSWLQSNEVLLSLVQGDRISPKVPPGQSREALPRHFQLHQSLASWECRGQEGGAFSSKARS